MLDGFYAMLLPKAGVKPVLEHLPVGVQATTREGESGKYLFVMNFSREAKQVVLPEAADVLTGEAVGGATELAPYGVRILKC